MQPVLLVLSTAVVVSIPWLWWCDVQRRPELVLARFGRDLEGDGHVDAADAVFAALAMRVPRHPIALQQLHRAATEGRATGVVLCALRLVVGAVPTNGRAWYDLGLALRAVGDEEAAVLALRQLVESDPDSGWADRAREELHPAN